MSVYLTIDTDTNTVVGKFETYAEAEKFGQDNTWAFCVAKTVIE